jgi:signal transduction histidine kinase/DNA-binding NarL/FixJ family response regulator
VTDNIRVLVVDDTPDIRMLLSAALGVLGGFEVVGEAEDGAEAIKLVGELRPDAVLLDLAMPVMDGLQAAPEIRRISPDTRIVILSGFSRDRLSDEARAAGADAYIEKGTSPKQIAEVLRHVCETTRDDGLDAQSAPEEPPETEPAAGDLEGWRKRISNAVEHMEELTSAFQSFGKAVGSRIAFDRATFSLSEPGGFRLAAVCGTDDGSVPVGTLVPARVSVAATLDEGTILTVDNATDHSDLDAYLLAPRHRSCAAVPVRAAGRAQAVISFSSEQPDAFAPDELDYLESAVREAAAAFHILWSLGRERDLVNQQDEEEQARRDWNRIVRHDLRTPLTVISGFAETMRSAWGELPDEKKLYFVDAISRGAEAMTTLLSDMEHVDRINSGVGAANVKPICLARLVGNISKDLGAAAGREVVTHIADGLPAAMADEQDHKRVLTNLIENAFKFSDPGSPVEVSVEVVTGMLHVTVTDHGVGIPPSEHTLVFEKFGRASQNGDGPKVPGSGLGLFICRSIVEAHGGRIWVESEPGNGASFHYTIPAASAAA